MCTINMKYILYLVGSLMLYCEAENQTCRHVTYNVQNLQQGQPQECICDKLRHQVESLETRIGCCERRSRDGSTFQNVYNITKPDDSYANDCTELFELGQRSTGVYLIQPKTSSAPFKAFCELAYDGWTIITRRFNGALRFYRGWEEYKRGFGSVFGEHWLGNEKIHHLTNQSFYELRVEFIYWGQQAPYFADYMSFRVDSEANKYKLHISGFSGTADHDTLSNHNNMPFSTRDRDNDRHPTSQCAQHYKGAFWYYNCHSHGVPTALYKPSCPGYDCITWKPNKPVSSVIWKVKSI